MLPFFEHKIKKKLSILWNTLLDSNQKKIIALANELWIQVPQKYPKAIHVNM